MNNTDVFIYGERYFNDTKFNRLAALTCTAVFSTYCRSVTFRNRYAEILASEITSCSSNYAILPPHPESMILGLWEVASITKISSGHDFFANFLVEVQANFNAATVGSKELITDVLKAILPQDGVSELPPAPGDDHITKQRNMFSRSYVFIPKNTVDLIQSPNYQWIVPWLILNHADYLMIESLIDSVANYTGAGHSRGNQE